MEQLVVLGFVAVPTVVLVVLVRLLPAGFRERMREGWRPWVWVPGGVALVLYTAAMVLTWAGAAHGDGWCYSERPSMDKLDIDVRTEAKWLPPFITCVYSDGVRIDAGGHE